MFRRCSLTVQREHLPQDDALAMVGHVQRDFLRAGYAVAKKCQPRAAARLKVTIQRKFSAGGRASICRFGHPFASLSRPRILSRDKICAVCRVLASAYKSPHNTKTTTIFEKSAKQRVDLLIVRCFSVVFRRFLRAYKHLANSIVFLQVKDFCPETVGNILCHPCCTAIGMLSVFLFLLLGFGQCNMVLGHERKAYLG